MGGKLFPPPPKHMGGTCPPSPTQTRPKGSGNNFYFNHTLDWSCMIVMHTVTELNEKHLDGPTILYYFWANMAQWTTMTKCDCSRGWCSHLTCWIYLLHRPDQFFLTCHVMPVWFYNYIAWVLPLCTLLQCARFTIDTNCWNLPDVGCLII